MKTELGLFLESQYFFFNYRYYVNPRYHLINANHQGVPTETSKSSRKIKSHINCAIKAKGCYSC